MLSEIWQCNEWSVDYECELSLLYTSLFVWLSFWTYEYDYHIGAFIESLMFTERVTDRVFQHMEIEFYWDLINEFEKNQKMAAIDCRL